MDKRRKAAETKLKAATRERDAFKKSADKAQAANEKRLAKLDAAVRAAQEKCDKYDAPSPM